MIYREAEIADISQIQFVRHAVKENRLSDPANQQSPTVYSCARGVRPNCKMIERSIGCIATAALRQLGHPDRHYLYVGNTAYVGPSSEIVDGPMLTSQPSLQPSLEVGPLHVDVPTEVLQETRVRVT